MSSRVLRALLFILPLAMFAAEKDALALEATIQARHLPYGGILDPMLSLPDLSQVVDYTRCGDSALLRRLGSTTFFLIGWADTTGQLQIEHTDFPGAFGIVY